MIDIICLTLLTIGCLFVTALNFFAYFVFKRKAFENKKIYKYLGVNSVVDALVVILRITLPFGWYYQQSKNLLSENYYFLFYNFYISVCFVAFIKGLSNYINVSISFYRFFEITHLNNINQKFEFKYVIVFLVFLAMITASPYLGLSKIIEVNNNLYVRVDTNLTIYGHDLKQIVVDSRRIHHLIVLTLIVIPNIGISVNLYRYIKHKKNMTIETIELNYNRNYSEVKKHELKMTYLTLSISITCIFDTILKCTADLVYFIIGYSDTPNYVVYTFFSISHFLHSTNVIVYYLVNDAFKTNVRKLFQRRSLTK